MPLIFKYFLEWPASGRGYVNFFLPVAIQGWTGSWTKAFWFNIQAEGQGSLRQPVICRQYPFSILKQQKQQEAKIKVKETEPRWSRNWLFLVTQEPWSHHFQRALEAFYAHNTGIWNVQPHSSVQRWLSSFLCHWIALVSQSSISPFNLVKIMIFTFIRFLQGNSVPWV